MKLFAERHPPEVRRKFAGLVLGVLAIVLFVGAFGYAGFAKLGFSETYRVLAGAVFIMVCSTTMNIETSLTADGEPPYLPHLAAASLGALLSGAGLYGFVVVALIGRDGRYWPFWFLLAALGACLFIRYSSEITYPEQRAKVRKDLAFVESPEHLLRHADGS